MPPTLAAARNTYSGLFSSKKASTSACLFRSSSPLERVIRLLNPSYFNFLTIAEPTSPRCPAMYIFDDLFMIAECLKPPILAKQISLSIFEILSYHLSNEFLKPDPGLPAKLIRGLRRIAEQRLNFRGTKISRIDFNQNLSGN